MKDESDVRKLIKALEKIEAKGYGELPIFIEQPEVGFARLSGVSVQLLKEGKEGVEGAPEKFITISGFGFSSVIEGLQELFEHFENTQQEVPENTVKGDALNEKQDSKCSHI
jgi:hypothetical protein